VKIGLHVPNCGTPVRHEGAHYLLDPVTFLPPSAQPSVLRVLPWSRPIEESARTVESGPPGR